MPRKNDRRGSIAVEAALMMTMLFAVGYVASDMHRIGIERTRLESAASSAAINIAAQPKLTRKGLDALTEIVMQGHAESQQMLIMSVMQSGRVVWALERGEAEDLCEPPIEEGYYTGDLPEDRPEESDSGSDEDNSTFSLVVVQACRDTGDIRSYGGILMPEVLQVEGIYRANAKNITIDDELQEENQITSEAEQEL
ncbi:hypothetical protein GKC30_12865 [Pseudodesulfovibrio sp. F-1]|uniref:Pilus assembly protein n=1 Tax=Pseudodesulfovibrio alkaliphilus TaxID=2661613 RepID=A0A7K1KR10_9BACT|nr:hypothetical protein [Pseudodesulfovibrio alkaliphilus]MUM78528.1 hypothetical protein [Pseudodesulfovibrio alkaliphilus]